MQKDPPASQFFQGMIKQTYFMANQKKGVNIYTYTHVLGQQDGACATDTINQCVCVYVLMVMKETCQPVQQCG